MGGRTWQPHEAALLESHAENDDWLPAVAGQIPNRSEASLRCRMSQIRISRGLADGREVDAGWMVDARRGARKLFERLNETGLRPT